MGYRISSHPIPDIRHIKGYLLSHFSKYTFITSNAINLITRFLYTNLEILIVIVIFFLAICYHLLTLCKILNQLIFFLSFSSDAIQRAYRKNYPRLLKFLPQIFRSEISDCELRDTILYKVHNRIRRISVTLVKILKFCIHHFA